MSSNTARVKEVHVMLYFFKIIFPPLLPNAVGCTTLKFQIFSNFYNACPMELPIIYDSMCTVYFIIAKK